MILKISITILVIISLCAMVVLDEHHYHEVNKEYALIAGKYWLKRRYSVSFST